MKKLLLILSLVFTCSMAFAQNPRYTADEFDLFPLTDSNTQLVEGVWTGKSVLIEIESMNFTYDNKPYMWVTISDKDSGEEKSALMYFHDEHDGYELYVFGLGKSVPIEIMIFKYSDLVAFERQMRCENGGYVMKLRFQLGEGETAAVELQRETCLDL